VYYTHHHPAMPAESYHLYALPPALLAHLTLRAEHAAPAPEPAPEPEAEPVPEAGAGARACNVCPAAAFASVDAQRAHFRADWHRYNVKLRLRGGAPVDAARFSALVEGPFSPSPSPSYAERAAGLEDSLSGSASSSSENDEESDEDRVSTLLHRTALAPRARSASPDAAAGAPRTALAWFHAPPATQLGVYRATLGDDASVEALKSIQGAHGPEGRTWALFMIAGGHFAGAVVRVSKTDADLEAEAEAAVDGNGNDDGRKKKKKARAPRADVEVLAHKTFHRYTTRRKQGGSQALHDGANGKAKSAGAQLRRYGEQALRADVQGLLAAWADALQACERVWVRASWASRRVFMEEDGGVFEKGDARVRAFPFPTRRPARPMPLRIERQ
jgi:hypothetical protein